MKTIFGVAIFVLAACAQADGEPVAKDATEDNINKTQECAANIDPISFGGTGSIEVEWQISVPGCAKSSGKYDFVLHFLDDNDEERLWERTRAWTEFESDLVFEKTDFFNVASDETLVDVSEYEVTECKCID